MKIRKLIGMFKCNPEHSFYVLLSIVVHTFWQGGRTLVYNIFRLGCCPQYDTNKLKWRQLSFSTFQPTWQKEATRANIDVLQVILVQRKGSGFNA